MNCNPSMVVNTALVSQEAENVSARALGASSSQETTTSSSAEHLDAAHNLHWKIYLVTCKWSGKEWQFMAYEQRLKTSPVYSIHSKVGVIRNWKGCWSLSSICELSNFTLVYSGVGYRALNTSRSALSVLVVLSGGSDSVTVENYPLVIKRLKGVFNEISSLT